MDQQTQKTAFEVIIGTLVSLLLGKLQKKSSKFTGQPTDTIPMVNTAAMGAVGLVSGNTITTVALVGGSVAANFLHQMWHRFIKKEPAAKTGKSK